MGALFYKCLCGLNIESKTAHVLAIAMMGVGDITKVKPADRSCTFY